MKKPYLISLASYTPGVEGYLESLTNLQDSVELIWVDFVPRSPHKEIWGLKDYWIHPEAGSYPGHHKRWQCIPDFLDQDRWWIFTDTQDVRFQRPIPDLDAICHGADVIVQYEGMRHDENQVWRECIVNRWPQLSYLLDKPVYNCGCWAARGHLMHAYKSFIAGWDEAIWDQLPFNTWLMNHEYVNSDVFSAALYDNWHTGRLNRLDGVFYWIGTGAIPAIVHGNGSSKELL